MQHSVRSPYKRIHLRKKMPLDWRKIAFAVLAVLVILSMIVMEILSLLPIST